VPLRSLPDASGINPQHLADAASPKKFASYLMKLAKPSMHMHDGMASLREADYKGHHIAIRTTYQVSVDGRALNIPLGVDNRGNLHCHSLPNYQFTSAVDMVKQLIDSFPGQFGRREGGGGHGGGGHGGHGGMHMGMPARALRATPRAPRKGRST